MGGTTAKGYPYPSGTDRVMDGDNAIKALASAIDDKAGVSAMGNVLMTPPAANQVVNAAITYPSGRFATGPYVFLAVSTSANAQCFAYVFSESATGAMLGFRRDAATPTNVHWLAVLV